MVSLPSSRASPTNAIRNLCAICRDQDKLKLSVRRDVVLQRTPRADVPAKHLDMYSLCILASSVDESSGVPVGDNPVLAISLPKLSSDAEDKCSNRDK